MSLKPMGSAEILMALIDKLIKDAILIKQEVSSTLPIQKRVAALNNEIIDPRTGKPFVLKKKSKPPRSKRTRREMTA